ncbi:MAG: nickel pincer cofactor biosynthesis protein LarC [Ruminococcus sp.]|jgi:uncharacterized protein (TIGR00299 family) protein
MTDLILYLEGSSGISGDMTVAALLDLGADEAYMRSQVEKLPLDHYRLITGRTGKKGIDSKTFDVAVEEEHQPHRTYGEIQNMIMESAMDQPVKELAVKIFHILALAEGKVHGAPADHVHFHEVGAVDSIVDIVGTAACICSLEIEETAIGTLREGRGSVMCQHGRMPVPVPAVAELVSAWGLPVTLTDTEGEMITPTGAAIAAALRTRELPDEMEIVKVGIGAGKKEFDHANVLRAMLVREVKKESDVWVLESNVDDCSGEQLGFLQEQLFAAGVKDAVFIPVYMKKNRPGYLLQVICTDETVQRAENLIFQESTTIGIRRYRAGRSVLERRMEKIPTSYGEIGIKVCYRNHRVYAYPEYEDVKKAAQVRGESFRRVYQEALGKAGELFGE